MADKPNNSTPPKPKTTPDDQLKQIHKETAKGLAQSAAETAARQALPSANLHQEAFDRVRDIPILGNIVSFFRTTSYIPGVEEKPKTSATK